MIIPFVIMFGLFSITISYFDPNNTDADDSTYFNKIIAGFQLVLSLYFLNLEFQKIFTSGLKYFKSIFNYITFMSPLMVALLSGIVLMVSDTSADNYENINATTFD